MKKIIVIVGKTATGKDTLCKHLKEKYDIPMVVSYADRPMRDYEENGVQHIFISKEEMDELEKQSDLLAYTKFPITNYRYCAVLGKLPGDVMTYILNPDGVEYLEKNANNLDAEFLTICLDAPNSILRERALGRGDKDSAFEQRLTSEFKQFDEFYESGKYDLMIDACKSKEEVFAFADEVIEKFIKE